MKQYFLSNNFCFHFLHQRIYNHLHILLFYRLSQSIDVTSILTGTVQEELNALSLSGIVEFLTDSIIKLDFVPIAEEFRRTLTIRKMRRTNHSVLIHPFKITKEGIKIIEIKEE
ncbi:MAG: ATPase domain-containing protein [Candidatus Aenigmatarchaeota archaeon]